MYNRIVLACVYLFIATFIIVDLVVVSQTAYNLVSLTGMIIYILLLFVCSHSPAKVSAFFPIFHKLRHIIASIFNFCS